MQKKKQKNNPVGKWLQQLPTYHSQVGWGGVGLVGQMSYVCVCPSSFFDGMYTSR